MKRILIVYSDICCSCTRKYSFELSRGLNDLGVKTDVIMHTNLKDSNIKNADVVIFQRLGANGGRFNHRLKNTFFDLIANNRDKIFLYHIDDLLLNQQSSLPIEFVKRVDGVIVTNESFYKYLYPYNKNVYYLRTFLDNYTVDRIKDNLNLPKNFKFLWATTGFIGKFFMQNLIPRILAKYPNAMLYRIGAQSDFGSNHNNYIIKSLLSFQDFIRYFKACDILLNPSMAGDREKISTYKAQDYVNCKSEIKYLNAAFCKIPIIASKTFPFRYAINHKINGLLANDTVEDWLFNIEQMINNSELRNSIIENAYIDVSTNYNLESASKKVISIIEDLKTKK